MNFFELINKCLLELNYRQVETFSSLVKNDHKRIMQIMNILNKEICNSENWDFLLRKSSIVLEQGQNELINTIPGKILYVMVDGTKYNYEPNIERYISGNLGLEKFCIMNNNLMFSKSDKDRNVDIYYYTRNCVKDEQDNEKENLENATDCTILPMPFGEQLLIYGTCMRLKANPQHVKFSYWLSMYKDAVLNLKSKAVVCTDDFPHVNLHRK